jgi:hypothetical protein
MAKEKVGEMVASNMIKLEVAFSLEDIARLTSISVERVKEIYSELHETDGIDQE